MLTVNSISKHFFLFCFIFFYVVSNWKFVYKCDLDHFCVCISFLGLFFHVLINNFILNSVRIKKNVSLNFVISAFSLFLLSVGLFQNNLPIEKRVVLFFTVFIFIFFVFYSRYVLFSIQSIRMIGYYLFFGIIGSIITSLLTNTSDLFEKVNGLSFIDISFSGGILYKNYFGGICLGVIICLYPFIKWKKYTYLDCILLFISFLFILLSASLGTYICFICFFIFSNMDFLLIFKKNGRFLFCLICLVSLSLFLLFFIPYLFQSPTYMYRLRGLDNWISFLKDNDFYLYYGASELLYNNNYDFVTNFRFLSGWDGSCELAWLVILIKEGLFGVLGYILIFVFLFIKIRKTIFKNYLFSIISVLFVSSFVEPYIISIHVVVGVLCFMILSYLSDDRICDDMFIFFRKRFVLSKEHP